MTEPFDSRLPVSGMGYGLKELLGLRWRRCLLGAAGCCARSTDACTEIIGCTLDMRCNALTEI